MSAEQAFDEALAQFQQAQRAFMLGDPQPTQLMFSQSEDVTLGNPLGPPVRGWQQVAAAAARAAAGLRDGEILGYETISKYVTPELGYIVWMEHAQAKVGNREDITRIDLRVTMILRPEAGGWKVIHRHADPITTVRPIESIIQT